MDSLPPKDSIALKVSNFHSISDAKYFDNRQAGTVHAKYLQPLLLSKQTKNQHRNNHFQYRITVTEDTEGKS